MEKLEDSFDHAIWEVPISYANHLIDLLLAQPNFAEILGLYTFYYYTAKWQKTNRPKATNNYTADGLQWCISKVKKYKAQLINLGLIENVQNRSADGSIKGHYIKVNFIWTQKAYDKAIERKTASRLDLLPVEIKTTNALSKSNINALSNNILLSAKLTTEDDINLFNNSTNNIIRTKTTNNNNTSKGIKITPELFDKFWAHYPRKAKKGDAFTAWNKFCKKPIKERPTWNQLRKAITLQIDSEQWQKDNQKWIPYASTWLNNNKWMNDPEEMKSWDTTNNSNSITTSNRSSDGTTPKMKYKE